MTIEESYIVCKTRRNRPYIRVEVCRQCKKKFGCKSYMGWLEKHILFDENQINTPELQDLRELTPKRAKTKKKPINVFEWKE